MKTRNMLQVACLAVWLPISASAVAGDADNGKALSAVCAACHGADGNSSVPTNPKLAGQYESYLIQALSEYRSGARKNAIMAGFAAELSDQEIKDLAAYFSSQDSSLVLAD